MSTDENKTPTVYDLAVQLLTKALGEPRDSVTAAAAIVQAESVRHLRLHVEALTLALADATRVFAAAAAEAGADRERRRAWGEHPPCGKPGWTNARGEHVSCSFRRGHRGVCMDQSLQPDPSIAFCRAVNPTGSTWCQRHAGHDGDHLDGFDATWPNVESTTHHVACGHIGAYAKTAPGGPLPVCVLDDGHAGDHRDEYGTTWKDSA